MTRSATLLLLPVLTLLGCSGGGSGPARSPAAGAAPTSAPVVLRVGHFPNITHVHGLVAHQLSRKGEGWFESRLGVPVTIEWFVYNAGPSAMEAILAGSLDLSYVGPNPAINAHVKSEGKEVRVLAGATLGGAALVVQGDNGIKSPADFRGKKVATPQLGNTQDVACRAWLKANGFNVTQLGGDVQVVPTQNPDQLLLFQSKEIDAAWTVEPWVSRLELEAGGKLFLEEKDAVTTVLAASAAFVESRREVARAFRDAHAELGRWIEAHPQEAQALLRAELEEETRIKVGPALEHAWPRMRFGSDLPRAEMERAVVAAKDAGFLEGAVSLERLFVAP